MRININIFLRSTGKVLEKLQRLTHQVDRENIFKLSFARELGEGPGEAT
jgi:hypothetical protein